MQHLEGRQRMPLLIAFADIHGFTRTAVRLDDDVALADGIDAYYHLVAERVDGAGGVVVKYIGDSALIVFGEDDIDAGVACLLALKLDVDAWLEAQGWAGCTLNVKAHFGDVVAGTFGPPTGRRFDVIGRAVNAAATLPSPGLAISPQAFRKLRKPTRERFKKHTPPITYIRVEDPHRN